MVHSAKTKAKMRKAWKRRKLAKNIPYKAAMVLNESNQWIKEFIKPDLKLGTQLRIRLPNDQTTETKVNGLIDRMTQAIDKIETQIKRLESL